MSRYCSKCGEEKPREAMTIWVGMLICQCDKGLPPKRVELKQKVIDKIKYIKFQDDRRHTLYIKSDADEISMDCPFCKTTKIFEKKGV